MGPERRHIPQVEVVDVVNEKVYSGTAPVHRIHIWFSLGDSLPSKEASSPKSSYFLFHGNISVVPP